MAKLPVTGVFGLEGWRGLRDQGVIESLIEAVILRLHSCGARRVREWWARRG